MAFGFFDRIKDGLEKTRKSFVKNVESIVIGYAQIDDDFLDDLEAVMLTSDLGPKTTEYLMKEIRRGVTEGIINHTGDVMPFMEDRITEMLIDQEDEITLHHPEVILVVGVNGVGKTTTIAKLANYYTKEGKKVIIAAGDTFRAAAAANYPFGLIALVCRLLNIKRVQILLPLYMMQWKLRKLVMQTLLS